MANIGHWRRPHNMAEGSGGTVIGPVTSTINAFPRWADALGTLLKDSVVLADDLGNVSGIQRAGMLEALLGADALLTREGAGILAARDAADSAYGILRTANPPASANDCVPLGYLTNTGASIVTTPPVAADFTLTRTPTSTLTWLANGAVLRSTTHAPGYDCQYFCTPWPAGNVYYSRHTWSGKEAFQFGMGGFVVSRENAGTRYFLSYEWQGRELGLHDYATSVYTNTSRVAFTTLGALNGSYGAPQPFVRATLAGTTITFAESLTGWPGTFVDAYTVDLAGTALGGAPDYCGFLQNNYNNTGTPDAARWDIVYQVDHAAITPPTLA